MTYLVAAKLDACWHKVVPSFLDFFDYVAVKSHVTLFAYVMPFIMSTYQSEKVLPFYVLILKRGTTSYLVFWWNKRAHMLSKIFLSAETARRVAVQSNFINRFHNMVKFLGASQLVLRTLDQADEEIWH